MLSNIKAYIKSVLKIILRNLLRILHIFPINENMILFSAFEGREVSDNPKCIYDFIKDHCPDQCQFVWVYNGDRKNTDLKDNVKIVKKHSLKWYYSLATAKIIVDNYQPTYTIPIRKEQLYIQTWHAGGAYKKIGSAYYRNKLEKMIADDNMNNTVNLFISSSEGFTNGTIKEGFHYSGEILNCGMPRNDIFFDNQLVKNSSEKIRTLYNLQGMVVLYAPTFRGKPTHSDIINATINTDMLRKALGMRFHQKVNVLVRYHVLDKHNYNLSQDIIDVSDYPNMQELLCASDILITDYSSSIWDYALLGRPCFLYIPDIDQYIKERGFFTPPEQWPGIVCRTMEELNVEIKTLDEEKCAIQARNHLESMKSYEKGYATETISNKILKYL